MIDMMNECDKIGFQVCEDNANAIYQGSIPGTSYGTDNYTEGIRRLVALHPDVAARISEVTKQFFEGDYGDMYEEGDPGPDDYLQEGYYHTQYGVIRIENRGGISLTYLEPER